MRIPIRVDKGQRFVEAQLIDAPPAVTAREWRGLLSAHSSGLQHDSVEFVDSAVSKWKLYDRRDRIATSQRQLTQMIDADPKIDVLAIVDAKADWSALGRRLGICQFRHTWSNSIAVDFLAVHPTLLAAQKPISGVGTALLYCIAQIAKRIKAQRIWLETTELSVDYYTHLFGDAVESDLLVVPTEKFYDALHDRFES